VTVRSLDIGLMQAGAGVKGEFEKRLRQVIDEVESSRCRSSSSSMRRIR
jgi:type VI secretion system protein VasG